MFDILDERQFYDATLAASGITPRADEIEKVAAAAQIPVGQAKIAKVFFEQLQLDGVDYESEQKRAEDAATMAKAFIEHVETAKTAATKVADGLVRFLSHAVEGYLAQHNLPLSALEALKVAGMQADSHQLAAEARAKIAAVIAEAREIEAKLPENEKTAAASMFGGDAVYGGNPDIKTLLPGQAIQSMTSHLPPTTAPADRSSYVMNNLGVSDPAHLPAAIHNFSEFKRQNPGVSDFTTLQSLQKMQQGQPGFLSRNAGPLAAAGAVGLGAMYLLHRKKQNDQDARDRAMHAAALPQA